jgi:signal transduction histidine kinase
LFAAFSLIALAFVASGVYANWLSADIENETRALTANALPSVGHLTRAIDALRDLEAAADDYADLVPSERASAWQQMSGQWKVVDTELDAYRELPMFPGEHELYADVPGSLREVDSAIDRLFATVESVDRERARLAADRDLEPKVDRAARLLRRIVRFNAEQAADSSNRIQATRRKVTRVVTILDGATLLFTAALAAWIWGIFQSYARLQRAHTELVQRRAQELEVFGRRVAHDLLSPLSALTFCLSAFKQVSETDPKLANALVRARRCVLRAQGLVDNVFDFARSGGAPSQDAATNVAEVVAEVVDEASTGDPSERPAIEVGPIPDCAVRCSRGVLSSILGNLVGNAVKFTRDAAERRVAIRVFALDAEVRFEVEDTGPGIPPGSEQAVFEPYVRGEGVTQPGLGLGLATVRRFCEAHGGTVGVRTALGRGSVFHVTLPRTTATKATATATATTASATPPASARVTRGSAS